MQLEAGALSGCVGGKCGPGKQEHPRDWEKLAVLCIWDPESSSDRPSSLHTKGLEVTSCSLEHTESPVMASKYHLHRRKPALPESTASPGLGRGRVEPEGSKCPGRMAACLRGTGLPAGPCPRLDPGRPAVWLVAICQP